MSLALTPGGQLAVDVDRHRLERPQRQRLGGEHVLDLRGADAHRQCAERAVRRGVAVAAHDRHARLGQAQLRSDDVHDALFDVAHRVAAGCRTPRSCAAASRPGCARPGRRSACRCRSSARCGPRWRSSGRVGAPGGRPAAARRRPADWSPRGRGADRCRSGRAPRGAPPAGDHDVVGPNLLGHGAWRAWFSHDVSIPSGDPQVPGWLDLTMRDVSISL